MKNVRRFISLVVLGLGSAITTLHGAVFDFSYTFGDGLIATGSLSGTQNGNFVENVSNVSLAFNGTAVSGSVFASRYDPNLGYLSGAVVSFDGLLNNFVFANSDLAGGDFSYDSLFYLFNAAVSPYGSATAEAYSAPSIASIDLPTGGNRWSLTAATTNPSVPEGGSTVVLLGLCLAGMIWSQRRR